MSMRFGRVFFVVLVAVSGLAISCAVAQTATDDTSSLRTWTSSNGQTVEAKFVKLEEGTVYFEKPDGSSIHITLESLSAADQEVVKSLQGGSKLSGAGLSKAGDGTLTEEEIAAMITESVDEKTGAQIELIVSFGKQYLSPKTDGATIRKYSNSGRIPIRLTVIMYETRNGQKKKLTGKCHFYVMDSGGQLLTKRTMSLDAMCPSWGGRGGYFGEVAKEGQYTAVAYVNYGGRVFGKQITVDLTPVQANP